MDFAVWHIMQTGWHFTSSRTHVSAALLLLNIEEQFLVFVDLAT
jgi:hypothetical protein